jgi:hypothetical protein
VRTFMGRVDAGPLELAKLRAKAAVPEDAASSEDASHVAMLGE